MSKLNVYIPVGGGLGDVLTVYLASPDIDVPTDQGAPPTPYRLFSLWYRRLKDFKEKHPDSSVKLICASHNPGAIDLFTHHPYIDVIHAIKWMVPKDEPNDIWNKEHDGYVSLAIAHHAEEYEHSDPVVYLDEHQNVIYNSITKTQYIVIHPFSGSPQRTDVFDLGVLKSVIDILIDEYSYTVVVVGNTFTPSIDVLNPIRKVEQFTYQRDGLVNGVNDFRANLSVKLAMAASGFIGCYSSMLVASWFGYVKSVCIAPEFYGVEPFQIQADLDVPVSWGLKQDFCKTLINKNNTLTAIEIIESLGVNNNEA